MQLKQYSAALMITKILDVIVKDIFDCLCTIQNWIENVF